jgi:cytochrome c biogenesis protein CcmG/thiol:disulfide interchange protein DsbE
MSDPTPVPDRVLAPDSSPAPDRALRPRTRRRLRILAFGVVPGLFCLVLVVGLVRTNTPRAVSGEAAPTFPSLPLLGGGTLSSADLVGKPVVFNFWASWCEPCQQEAPTLEAVYKQYQAQGVTFIGVDYEDLNADAETFIHSAGITYPILLDPGGTLATQFGITGVPQTYFVDRQYRFFSIGEGGKQGTKNGTVVLGAVSKPLMISQINGLLAYKASSPSP